MSISNLFVISVQSVFQKRNKRGHRTTNRSFQMENFWSIRLYDQNGNALESSMNTLLFYTEERQLARYNQTLKKQTLNPSTKKFVPGTRC